MHDSAYAKRQIALLDRVIGGCGSRVQRLAFIGSQRLWDYAACFQRLPSSARPGQCGELRLPQIDADGPHWRLDGAALRQFWQMPWAICLCVTGNRPQWLFYDEVERGVFVQCCREAHLALHTASVEQPTSF